MWTMKQLGLGLEPVDQEDAQARVFGRDERVVPWAALVQIVAPYYPKVKTGRPPFGIETMP
jgi:IS5 family transposase